MASAHPEDQVRRTIALIAHDNKKSDLTEWARLDVKALLRLAGAWNIPVACNRASADFVISSLLFAGRYDRLQPDFADYANRTAPDLAASPAIDRAGLV